MQVAGLIPTSFIEYTGEISLVVFCQGCNFRCTYCYNKVLIPITKGRMSERSVYERLKTCHITTAVVLSGGEPTVQRDLVPFLECLKEDFPKFKVKIETNGSNPEVLEELLHKKLLDCVQCDLKTTQERYKELTGQSSYDKVTQSIKLIKKTKVPYELRTVVGPHAASEEDYATLKQLYPELTKVQEVKSV